MRSLHREGRGKAGCPGHSPGVCQDVFVSRGVAAPGSQAGPPCDLHAHTRASDGSLSPEALARYARDKGLKAVGICDHDTMSGVMSLYPPGRTRQTTGSVCVEGVEIVPGVEINSMWNGLELHVLGYYIPAGEGPFRLLLDDMQASREERVYLTVRRLEGMGMHVDLSRVRQLSAGDSIGRPHVAQAMAERGYVGSVKEAFERYLGIGKPAYVERGRLEPKAAVQAIRSAGGVPVWAHPGTSHALSLIRDLVDGGLLGIEAFHPGHDRRMSETCLLLAKEYNLVVTGGSDFHGLSAGEGGDLGSTVVPYAVVSRLKGLASSGTVSASHPYP